MAVVWAPQTLDDFERIFAHNLEWKGVDRAESIEMAIRRHGDRLTRNSGIPWGRPNERRSLNADDYWLFFRVHGDDIQIFAVFHAKENWTVLTGERQ